MVSNNNDNVRCSECKHFVPFKVDEKGSCGECRESPPAVFPMPVMNQITREQTMNQLQFWPRLAGNLFCGCFKEKNKPLTRRSD